MSVVYKKKIYNGNVEVRDKNGRRVVERICLFCKNKFYVPPCMIKTTGKHRAKFCSKKCNAYVNGFLKGNNIGNGEKNGRWKGGVTRLSGRMRSLKIYADWRKNIFERDNYTCVLCGHKSNGDIEADHIVPSALIVSLYKIETMEEVKKCVPLWDINNGRTLCKECHRKTPTYASNYYHYLKNLI